MSLLEQAGTNEDTSNTNQDTTNQGTQTTTEQAQASWMWADGMIGNGDKPEWLKDKYKTVEEQAKAYNEAEKRLGAFTGAPKDGYDTTFLEGTPIDKESPHLHKLLETAKELNISQDAMQQLMGVYAEYEGIRTPNFEKELEKLGETGKQQLVVLNQWAKNNLSADEYNYFAGRITTAEDVRLFMKLRGLAKEPAIPTKPGTNTQAATIVQLKQQIIDNYDAYKNNTNGFRDKITTQLAQLGADA